MSNKLRSVRYIGITGNFQKRISNHASGPGSVFTERYNLTDLGYYEEYQIARKGGKTTEKQETAMEDGT